MIGTSVIILLSVLGVVIVFGVITNIMQGPSRGWRLLAERYPPASVNPEAKPVRTQIFIGAPGEESFFQRPAPGCWWFFMPWTWRRGVQEVVLCSDEDHLHLERSGGPGVSTLAISIPWAAVEFGNVVQHHLGQYAMMSVDEVDLAIPVPAIEQELEIRRALQSREGLGENETDPYA
ncbi:MAG: hypothetical protein EA380_04785 [Phycisphaeraceae bacterium]|nr:MAG: hypothetical protein EA380_04785 [Phycisphaeraceae bacterium]